MQNDLNLLLHHVSVTASAELMLTFTVLQKHPNDEHMGSKPS